MKSFALASMVSLASAMCNHGTLLNPRGERSVVPSFSYTGVTGPLGWHGLSPDNSACAEGQHQAPIDISSSSVTTVSGQTLGLQLPSYPSGAEIENLGTTLEVFVNGSITVNNVVYSLRQFHFHTPSEHRVDSEHYAAEVHFVFESAAHTLTVLGFLIEVGRNPSESLPLLNSVFQNINTITQTGAVGHTGSLNFTQLINHARASQVFRYSGSLTTPPCDEGVIFNIVRNPIYIDVLTYRAAKHVMKFNSRYTQNHPGQPNLLQYASDLLTV
ncbi:hypothetical protein S7711_04361 [Stachybotrys chartarum IBT 7711]|uniref:Carbonic anhydrase n=1 Tax=Stachybotrys chartarum (strain CBS 109288 / IBT 7711) TaxID=1280523 RepID=A0A084AY73_STACB|nr:hypothetical protein S7711_04361 [Stachybotrys chartarum IBT 7711]KFA55765.1 hypothetical protein S40293_01976 [Stachybotrys chartarum IBT 40293]KFA79526.1 hypothetical protein S40288_01136 [Stachybotrys chartarum IBT 40288]